MRERLAVSISLSGALVASETLMPDAGPHVVVFSTTIAAPETPFGLHSTYVGRRGHETAVTHMLLAPACDPILEQRRVRADALPVADDERQLCLYDHLQHLLTALTDHGLIAQVEVGDQSIVIVNR